jgi:hypothetical protein
MFTVELNGGLDSLQNTGSCPLYIGSLDASGNAFDDRLLEPGDVIDHYQPSPEATSVYVVCHKECEGKSNLTYEDPDLVA